MADKATAIQAQAAEQQRVMIVGSAGKMGRAACKHLAQDTAVSQVIAVTRQDDLQVKITTDKPDVILELTDKDAVFANSLTAVNSGTATVVGASGLSESQLQQLDKLARKQAVPIWVVPNFSVAAVLMVRAAEMAATWLSDCEIIEYHHAEKKDAPSATSLHTANRIASQLPSQAVKRSAETAYVHQGRIPIHSVRAPGFLAKQDVIFSQAGESLTVSLSQLSRDAFMPGISLALARVRELQPGLHMGLEVALNQNACMPDQVVV